MNLDRLRLLDFRSFKSCGLPKAYCGVGVNDWNDPARKRIALYTEKEFLSRNDISFIHTIRNFTVNGFCFGDRNVMISYTRRVSLLGMDILKDYNCKILKETDTRPCTFVLEELSKVE